MSNENGQKVQVRMPNGQPVQVDYDSLSIAERATVQPAAWEHAQVHVRGGGHGVGNGVRVKVYNGPVSANRTSSGVRPSGLAVIVLLVLAAFVINALINGGA